MRRDEEMARLLNSEWNEENLDRIDWRHNRPCSETHSVDLEEERLDRVNPLDADLELVSAFDHTAQGQNDWHKPEWFYNHELQRQGRSG